MTKGGLQPVELNGIELNGVVLKHRPGGKP